jgi:hypothetical protein
MRNLLLHSPSKDGLYPWPSGLSTSRSPAAFIGECVSMDTWHLWLGHPALRIVKNTLSKHCLASLSNKPSQVCPACQQGKCTVFISVPRLPFQILSYIYCSLMYRACSTSFNE